MEKKCSEIIQETRILAELKDSIQKQDILEFNKKIKENSNIIDNYSIIPLLKNQERQNIGFNDSVLYTLFHTNNCGLENKFNFLTRLFMNDDFIEMKKSFLFYAVEKYMHKIDENLNLDLKINILSQFLEYLVKQNMKNPLTKKEKTKFKNLLDSVLETIEDQEKIEKTLVFTFCPSGDIDILKKLDNERKNKKDEEQEKRSFSNIIDYEYFYNKIINLSAKIQKKSIFYHIMNCYTKNSDFLLTQKEELALIKKFDLYSIQKELESEECFSSLYLNKKRTNFENSFLYFYILVYNHSKSLRKQTTKHVINQFKDDIIERHKNKLASYDLDHILLSLAISNKVEEIKLLIESGINEKNTHTTFENIIEKIKDKDKKKEIKDFIESYAEKRDIQHNINSSKKRNKKQTL